VTIRWRSGNPDPGEPLIEAHATLTLAGELGEVPGGRLDRRVPKPGLDLLDRHALASERREHDRAEVFECVQMIRTASPVFPVVV